MVYNDATREQHKLLSSAISLKSVYSPKQYNFQSKEQYHFTSRICRPSEKVAAFLNYTIKIACYHISWCFKVQSAVLKSIVMEQLMSFHRLLLLDNTLQKKSFEIEPEKHAT